MDRGTHRGRSRRRQGLTERAQVRPRPTSQENRYQHVENIGEHALATLLENTDDAVVVTDASGAIRYWNSAAEAMFGHSPEEAIGASLDIIIPEKLRERHWAGYRRVMATGETQYVGLNTSRAAAFTARRGRA
jgi:PAS domain-containing protein